MGRDPLSSAAYKSVRSKVEDAGGEAAFAGKQRQKAGQGLHELVDPAGYGVIRRSYSWLEPKGKFFELLRGTAMLEETRLDTTGSMGNNVDIAFNVLPKTYELLKKVKNAVLSRYDVQMITAIFGDVCDNYILCRSQAEMDERIAEQMTLMVPEGQGGDVTEDPQYGLFGAAYLTHTTINQLGLKTYDFTITDAPGRDYLSKANLIRVFGESVFDKVKENGHQIDPEKLPHTKQIVQDLLKSAHAFVLLVGNSSRSHWEEVYGSERVVTLPRTELLPEVKAAIIGLTEGTLSLSNVERFLIDSAGTNQSDATVIQRAVAGIPIGAQAELPNFDKIPLKGVIFAKKDDLWPMEISTASEPDDVVVEEDSEEGSMWE